jgi:hypothetical protein
MIGKFENYGSYLESSNLQIFKCRRLNAAGAYSQIPKENVISQTAETIRATSKMDRPVHVKGGKNGIIIKFKKRCDYEQKTFLRLGRNSDCCTGSGKFKRKQFADSEIVGSFFG